MRRRALVMAALVGAILNTAIAASNAFARFGPDNFVILENSLQGTSPFYPERAMVLGKQGDVLLQCEVGAQSSVTNCSVLSESPPHFGFGFAALKFSRQYRLRPEEEAAAKGRVLELSIRFRADPRPSRSAPATPFAPR